MPQLSRRSFLIGLSLSAWSGMLLAACGPFPSAVAEARSSKPRQQQPVSEADLQALVLAHSTFALNMYRLLRTQPGNLFFSPYSVVQALTMALIGARGATAAQMRETLQFTLPEPALYAAANALDQALLAGASEDGAFQLEVVNSVWGQKGYAFQQQYLDMLAEFYGAGLRLLDFEQAPDEARKTINSTVEQQTRGMIKDLLPEQVIDSLTRLVLTNAVYFKAKWLDPFKKEATTDRPFTLAEGSTVDVPAMHQRAQYHYAEGDGYQAAALPYQGGTSLLLLLPAAGQFDAFEQTLDAARLSTIAAALAPREVDLQLPKFDYRSQSLSLSESLQALGMRDPFEASVADFSGIDGTDQLFISDVVHQAAVRLDEEGTEAAATSAVIMTAGSAMPNQPVTLIVDRPFLFAIRHDATQALLFLGRVSDPRAA